ncbi:MAG: hypothetical protein AAFY71_12145 [Bacteroidota bacterium]
MNRILQISLLVLMLGACQNNHEESTSITKQEQLKQEITEVNFITDGSKLYSAADSSDFSIRVSAHKGQVRINFNLSDSLSFIKQIEELKLVLSQAEKDFNLDSIQRIHLDFFSKCPDLAIEISQIPSIQSHLDSCEINNVQFLDHRFLGKEILKSELIQRTIKCFEKFKFNPSNTWLEKCHSSEVKRTEIRHLKEELNEKKLKILRCAHLALVK